MITDNFYMTICSITKRSKIFKKELAIDNIVMHKSQGLSSDKDIKRTDGEG